VEQELVAEPFAENIDNNLVEAAVRIIGSIGLS
jgi:hypothetical protein